MTDHQAQVQPPAGGPLGEEERAYVALLRTAYQLEWDFAGFLKPHELSPTQYNALRILRGAGSPGLPCTQVAERMMNQDSDITRLMDRLEKRGLVTRERGKKDRRVICATISAKGLTLLKNLDGPVSDYVKRRMTVLGGRLGEFAGMLERLTSVGAQRP
ncbi:MAG TPA: MarR family transcriptional regulator [Terriglobales bacterium]|nr:MarR family transcriptional regulator [Terriglobales bacterium]